MEIDLKKIVKKRLLKEIKRHGLDQASLVETSGLPAQVVKGYLNGSQKIDLSEISNICKPLGLNPLFLVSPNYTMSFLQFRGGNEAHRETVSKLEQALLLLREYIEPPQILPTIDRTLDYRERNVMTAIAGMAAKEAREKYGSSIPEAYQNLGLACIPVHQACFEAFFLSMNNKYVVCVNSQGNAFSRINFSLAHELAHFIFDRDRECPVDYKFPDMFRYRVNQANVIEFFAMKFAQFFLVPFDRAESFAIHWPNIDIDEISELLNDAECSKDVVTNAVYDCISMRSENSTRYNDIKNVIDKATASRCVGIRSFIENRSRSTKLLLEKVETDFSPSILNQIKELFYNE
jgi:Domain of unknown function (DUF955).